jgi:long-chain fatty acid transport protein
MPQGFRLAITVGALAWLAATSAYAQPLGVELHNTAMPASGGMGGASIARPQDMLSALNGNPAALTHYRGTEFVFGTGWIEPTYAINQGRSLPLDGVTPFSGKSHTPGAAIGNIGASQQFDVFGIDSTFGIALTSAAGGGTDFRYIPASNGSSNELVVLQSGLAAGFKLTDRLSAGATLQLGSGFFDGPFVGLSAMVPAYGLRGTVGMGYDVNEFTTLGAYYQTRQHYDFLDAVRLYNGGRIDVSETIRMDLPDNVGLGIANRRLMDGRLLLAMDVIYKNWGGAQLFESIYQTQWAWQFGTQYSYKQWRLRSGYVFALNPLKPVTAVTVGGITLPDGIPGVNYLQAQMAVISQNRITAGIGRVDVIPGIDVDVYAGGMFPQTAQIDPFTSASICSYWVGGGVTWRPCPGRFERRVSK